MTLGWTHASRGPGRPVQILLVEDNPGDVRLVQEGMREAGVPCKIAVATDGEEAMQMLRRVGRHSDAVVPDLVLLDLNLPKRDGREVLSDIKADPTLRSIPVVILTTSRAEEDIARCYSSHANCYVTKPVDLDRFLHVVKAIERFWLDIVSLPTRVR